MVDIVDNAGNRDKSHLDEICVNNLDLEFVFRLVERRQCLLGWRQFWQLGRLAILASSRQP